MLVGAAFAQSDLTAHFDLRSLNEQSRLIRGTLSLESTSSWVATNRSGQAVLGPLHVVIATSDDRVQLLNVLDGPGQGPYSNAYVDLSGQLNVQGALMPGGAITGAVRGIRDKDVPFFYELTIFGRLNQPPDVTAGGPYQGEVGTPIGFDASSSVDPEGQPLDFFWRFGDGSEGTNATVSHVYALPGLYQAEVLVQDDLGATTTVPVPVLVTSTASLALARSRALTGEGIPLEEVSVDEEGPGGSQRRGAGGSGFLSLGQVAGEYQWTFSHPDYLTVYRSLVLQSNSVDVLPHPWMTRRPVNPTAMASPLSSTTATSENRQVVIDYPVGAFSQITPVSLTGLHPQALPGLGPPGWSPLAAFWLELDLSPTGPGQATVSLLDPVVPADRVAVAAFDGSNRSWRVISVPSGLATNRLSFSLPGPGVFAVWVADDGVDSPPDPVVGDALPPSLLPWPDRTGITATSRADPARRPTSTNAAEVTTTGIATFQLPGPAPSGMGFPVWIEETYSLIHGQTTSLPDYDSYIIAYRRPGGSAQTLQARFPLRPRWLLDSSVLDLAELKVSIRAGELPGMALTSEGGIWQFGDFRFPFAPGTLPGPSALSASVIDPANLPAFAVAEPVAAFRLDMPDLVQPIPMEFGPVEANSLFVLARQLNFGDSEGWKPVERMGSDGAGDLFSLEPPEEPRLPGLIRGGQYGLFRVGETQVLVTGVARDVHGDPAPGTRVTLDGQPWTDRADTQGIYRLLAPAGTHRLLGTSSGLGLEGEVEVTVTGSETHLPQDLSVVPTGPRILITEPAHLATNVRVVSSFSAVFSKAVDVTTVDAGAVSIVGPSGTVSGVISLAQDRRRVVFLPDNPLLPDTVYTAAVSATVRDLLGQSLAGMREFSFTTAPILPRSPSGLTIYEPGATNCPCAGVVPGYSSAPNRVVCVEGGPGTADPDTALILVNDTQGETATVVSNPDGSFLNFISAAEDDFIHVTFVNQNGTRIRIPATRQLFDDGRVGLYRAGGILEAESDGGPVQIFIEPGAVERRMVFEVDALSRTDLLSGLDNTEPVGGKILGGALYAEELDELREAGDIQLPLDLSILPPGTDPASAFFSLAVPLERDGKIFYQQIDRMDFVPDGSGGGFLETRSPPFIGLLARRLNALETSGYAFQSTRARFSSSETDATRGRSALTLVALWQQGIAGPGNREVVIAGQVIAKPLNGDASTERPVGGAVVTLRDGFLGPPDIGTLPVGQVVVLSDRDGGFGMAIPFAEPEYFLSAIHPRFFGQIANSAAFGFVAEEETVIRVTLPFALGADDASAGSEAPPILSVGHTPTFPPEGLATNTFATVIVSAVDDDVITAISAEVGESRDPFTDALFASNKVNVTEVSTTKEPGRWQRIYHVQSEKAARVRFTFRATDNIEQESVLEYPLTFGGTLPVPVSTNVLSRFYIQKVWPLQGATNVPAGTPITVRFNRPPHSTWLESDRWSSWLTLKNREVIAITSPDDPREINIQYIGAPADAALDMTISKPLQAIDGTEFNQTGDTNTPAAFSYSIHLAQPVVVDSLPELSAGAGVQMRGAFAYAIEGQGGRGTLKVYSLLDPHRPLLIQTLPLEVHPTDLAILDRYPLAEDVKPNSQGGLAGGWSSGTGSFVCVFSGLPSSSELPDPKFLSVFRISPTGTVERAEVGADSAEIVAGISINPASTISKSKWDPPFLGYLDFSSEGAGLNLLNFQSFYSGSKLTFQEKSWLPIEPLAGRDANRDGDYVDPPTPNVSQDKPPLPGRTQVPLGRDFAWAPLDANELLIDFDFSSQYGLVGALTRHRLTGNARYWTVLSRYPADLSDAFVEFGGGKISVPRRVFLLPAVTLDGPNGPVLKDFALVSFAGRQTNEQNDVYGFLRVVDITIPNQPLEVNLIRLPKSETTANTLEMREDGLLALVTGQNSYLLDPARLLELPSDPFSMHPAFIQRIEGTGLGARKTVSDASGINLNGFGNGGLVQADPALEILRFNRSVFHPSNFIGQAQALWDVQESPSVLDPLNFTFDGLNDPAPPSDPERHYYVKVHAPGSLGSTLPLALVAAASNGRTYQGTVNDKLPTAISDEEFGKKVVVSTVVEGMRVFIGMVKAGRDIAKLQEKIKGSISEMKVPPENLDEAVQFGDAVENLIGLTRELLTVILDFIEIGKQMPNQFTGLRMSNDPTHPDFNVYLAGPFVLSTEPINVPQLTKLKIQQPSRVYLQASPYVWAGLGPTLADNPLVGRYTSQLDYSFNLFKNTGIGTATDKITDELFNALDGAAAARSGDGPANAAKLSAIKVNLILAFVDYFDEILDGQFRAEAIPGAHVRKPVAVNEPNPVIFIPGIMGSYLEVRDLKWPVLGNAWIPGALFDRAKSLELNEFAGPRFGDDIVPSDVLRVLPEGFNQDSTIGWDFGVAGTIEYTIPTLEVLYRDVINHLRFKGYTEYDFRVNQYDGLLAPFKADPINSASGMELRRRLDGKPRLDLNPSPLLFVYPYDWRKDNGQSAARLHDYVQLIRAVRPDAGKIDIVAHSMGGLVARRYIEDHPGEIDRLITVGSPFLGAPDAFMVAKTGDFDDMVFNIIIPSPNLRRLATFLPGLHQLMPAQGLFNLGATPFRETGWDINENGIAYENYTYEEYIQALRGPLLRDVLKDLETLDDYTGVSSNDHPAAANSEAFHQRGGRTFGDWTQDDTGVSYHHIVGMQGRPNTIGRVEFSTFLLPETEDSSEIVLSLAPVEYMDADNNGPDPDVPPSWGGDMPDGGKQMRLIEVVEFVRVTGDGTVPLTSSARGYGSANSLNAPQAKVYPVVTTEAEDHETANHNKMLVQPYVMNLISDLLARKPVEVTEVSLSVPATGIEGTPVTVSATATLPSGASNPQVVFDFGDGSTKVLRPGETTATHVYDQDGTFTVSCGIRVDNGIHGFRSATIDIQNAPPQVELHPLGFISSNEIFNAERERALLVQAQVRDPGFQDRHTFRWFVDGEELQRRLERSSIIEVDGTDRTSVVVKVEVKDEAGAIGTSQKTFFFVNNALNVGGAIPPPQFDEVTNAFKRSLQLRVARHARTLFDPEGLTIETTTKPNKDLGVVMKFTGDLTGLEPEQKEVMDAGLGKSAVKILYGIVSDIADKDMVSLQLFPEDTAGKPLSLTKVSGNKDRTDVMLQATLIEDGVATYVERYEFDPPSSILYTHDFTYEFSWLNRTGFLDEIGFNSGPDSAASGLAARDQQGPFVTGIMNPWSRNIYLFGQDNFTPSTNLEFFVGYDTTYNGVFTGEKFYQLTNSVIAESAFPAIPLSIIARDNVNNVSAAIPFQVKPAKDKRLTDDSVPGWQLLADDEAYCSAVTNVKAVILQVLSASLGDAFLRQFLLADEHIWLEEQGSGAALWRSEDPKQTCEDCAKSGFKPKAFAGSAFSDNDYHFFLPTVVEPFRDFNDAAAKAAFLAGPQLPENFIGDWYHKPPEAVDADGNPVDPTNATYFVYTYPSSFTSTMGRTSFAVSRGPSNVVLGLTGTAAFLKNPLTPADAIALVVDKTLQTNPQWRKDVPEMTPFAARREHFMWGQWALDLPPEFSDDPLGDAAMGRQMLSLKIILESEVITNVPGYAAVSSTAPSYDDVLVNMKAFGIPPLEGYEWGLLQEFNALHGNPYVYVEPPVLDGETVLTNTPSGHFFEKRMKKSLKKLGKSGIRGALAWMACSTDTNVTRAILNIDRPTYQSKFGGFEEYILNIATNHASEFGGYAQYLDDWYQLKTGDDATMTRIIRAGQYPSFVQITFQFLHDLQARGLAAYEQGLRSLYHGTENDRLEYDRRTNSYFLVTGFTPIDRVDGIYQMIQDDHELKEDVAASVFNLGRTSSPPITITFLPGVAPGLQFTNVGVVAAFSNITVVGNAKKGESFYFKRTLADRSVKQAAIQIVGDAGNSFGNSIRFDHKVLTLPTSLQHTVNFFRVTAPLP